MAEYNDPTGGTPSSIGSQYRTDHYIKKALIELKKEQFFGQLANVTAMPRNYGKTIKRYHYMPLLDDRNVNDQGIDASGAVIADGNIYGSSKDIGTITGKLPTLTENGGSVNRVGFTRIDLTATLEKYGFYSDYTQESLDFDTDSELLTHINREMIFGANEIVEDVLQTDLINAAATVRYPGSVSSYTALSGEDGAITEVTYDDLMRLSIDLDDNRTPKQTRIITGSRMIDTKVVRAARVLYIGSEMIPTLEAMEDSHSRAAFVPLAHYANAGTEIVGEIGSIGYFRVVVVPEMQRREGVGVSETTANTTPYRTTSGKYDAFPLMCVGDGSFTTIGFQTDGKTVKFKIKHSKPGTPESYANDKYGETGFMSIKWYYGFMALRSERIGLIWSVARV